MLHCIVYLSKATREFVEDDLLLLLEQSRQNNAANGVKGMLLYRDMRFIQVIEGERNMIKQLMETIARDPRHTSVVRLFDQTITDTSFDDWVMGYRRASEEQLSAVEGYVAVMQERGVALEDIVKAGDPLDLLTMFRDSNWSPPATRAH